MSIELNATSVVSNTETALAWKALV